MSGTLRGKLSLKVSECNLLEYGLEENTMTRLKSQAPFWRGRRILKTCALTAIIGVQNFVGWTASAEIVAVPCADDATNCGEIRFYNDGWFTYSDTFLEGSRQALITDDVGCNSIDYTVRKDLLKGQVHSFIVPAPCHYTLIANVAGAIGKASTKTIEFSLTQGCEVKVVGTGSVDASHLKLNSNEGDTGCGEQ